MSNTYTWQIDSMDCVPSLSNQTNVVSNVHWTVFGTDGIYVASTSGVQPLSYTVGSPFTEYANLQQAQVLSWIQAAMGATEMAAIQSLVAGKLINLSKPASKTIGLPWA